MTKADQKKYAVNKELITVMKAVQKKAAINKKPVGSAQKKPGANSAQTEPAAHKKPAAGHSRMIAATWMAGCYRTIATSYHAGNCVKSRTPTMFMEVGADGLAWLVGELSCGYTCIGGQGKIKPLPGGREFFIHQGDNISADCIGAETDIGQCYGGFISAKVTSIVPGTLVQSQKTDPDLTTSQSEEEDEMPAAPPSLVVAEHGDVICKFSTSSIDATAMKPEVFFHMMRPMLSENVAMLRARGLMWNSLQNTGTLSEVIYDWDRALLQLGEPDLTGAHLPRSLHVLPFAQMGTPMVACARGLTAVAGSRSCGGVGVRVITPEFGVG